MTQLTPIHETVLPNGLTVLCVPHPEVGVVTVDAWVAVGSADETPALGGVSHFLEHMLFKGTERYGVGQIDREVERVGGYINAGTSHDFTHYYVTLAADRFDTALHIVAEVLQHSQLPPEELEKERQVILEEYARKQDNPQGLLWEELYDCAFLRGPYKAPVLGTPESLAGIDRAAMLDYYRRLYAPENISLVIVGDVDPVEAVEKASAAFADFQATVRPVLRPEETATQYARGAERVVEKEINETYGVLAFPAPAMGAVEEAYALDVLQFVLGGGRASVLYQEIKEKRRLANAIGASYANSRYPDLFLVMYTCEGEKRDALEEAVLEILAEATRTPPAPRALERARVLLSNSHAFSVESTNGESSSVGYYRTICKTTEFERNYMEGVRTVSAAQVIEQAQRLFDPGALVRACVRPRQGGAS